MLAENYILSYVASILLYQNQDVDTTMSEESGNRSDDFQSQYTTRTCADNVLTTSFDRTNC